MAFLFKYFINFLFFVILSLPAMDHTLEGAVRETEVRLDNMQFFLENSFDVDMAPPSKDLYRRLCRTHHERAELLKLAMDRLEFILKRRAKLDVQE